LVVVMAAGLRNGLILAFACRRRARALRDGITVTGRVVDRSRRVLAQDIMIAVVEADVPRPTVSPDLSYRRRDPECTRRCRFTETCPGDHWARFEPGTEVTLKYDPTDLRNFAVLLF
jgi:hypothetical protein